MYAIMVGTQIQGKGPRSLESPILGESGGVTAGASLAWDGSGREQEKKWTADPKSS